jgi:hypothetical protein
MKKVLLITYYFPPMPSIGAIRPGGLAKYLPMYGWEPIILTSLLPGEPNPQFRIIQTQDDDITKLWKTRLGLNPQKTLNENFNISRQKQKMSWLDKIASLPYDIITYPDVRKGWYTSAIQAGDKLLQNEQIDAILSSSAPIISHIIAKTLAEKYHIPWIADLRDLWTQDHYYSHCNLRRIIDRRLEIQTLGQANALVTVSKPLAKDLSCLHTDIPIYDIPNGYDPDDAVFDSPKLTNKFTITYTGGLMEGKRDPALLFEALRKLITDGIVDPNHIEVRFFGPQDRWLIKEIKKFNLDDVVKVFKSIPRDCALHRQRESHLLLLLLWDNPKEIGVFTGKIFEYLASKRPILALNGPKNSVVKDLLEETRTGHYITSRADLEMVLSKYYLEYLQYSMTPSTDTCAISKYSQVEMARKFSEILNKIDCADTPRS